MSADVVLPQAGRLNVHWAVVLGLYVAGPLNSLSANLF